MDGTNVGINEKNPMHALHINGNVGDTGEFLALSDRRVKRAIENIPDVDELKSALRPVTYHYGDEKEDHLRLPSNLQYGLIAQEVEEIIPSLVTNHVHDRQASNDETVLKGLNYTALIPILIKSHQEQAEQLKSYEALIDTLLQRVALLEERLGK